jgi:hypothetical protein
MAKSAKSFLLIAILFSLVFPRTSPGAGSGMDPLLAAGEAYSNLEFEKALSLIDAALGQKGNERERLIKIYHLQGLCLATLGKFSEAKEAFRKLLALDPSFRLGTDVAPKVRAPFDDAVAEVVKRLEVRLVPPATVKEGERFEIVLSSVSDPAGMIRALVLALRREGGKYSTLRVEPPFSAGRKIEVAPALWASGRGAVQWYGWVEGENGTVLQRLADEGHPMDIVVITKEQGALVASRGEKVTPWYKKWWVWAIVGGVAAGGATAGVLAARSGGGAIDFGVDFGTAKP